jgi:tRNA A64-2'-O-ribosylphosphate transferase
MPHNTTTTLQSTDGHTGNWDFSTTRTNLHVALVAAKEGGAVIVDSTRKGKLAPIYNPIA